MTNQREILWAPWRLEYIQEDMKKPDCFLCDARETGVDRAKLVLVCEDEALAIMNRYPYNNGHLLIAPTRHVGDLSDLDLKEMLSLFDLTRQSVEWLRKAYSPHGFNIGINLGRVAGAGLPGHLHVHVVPRWDGDTNFMPVLGGVKVVSEGLLSSYDTLRRIIEEE